MDMGQIVIGLVGGLIVSSIGGIILYLFNYFKVAMVLKKGQISAGNYLGLLCYNKVLSRIKDEKLRKEMYTQFKEASNSFDIGWESGLDGVKL